MTAAVTSLLTKRQQRILNVIRDYYSQHGYAPSLREIGERSGLYSVSAVNYQVRQLHEKGWIRKHPNRPRALVVLNPATGGE